MDQFLPRFLRTIAESEPNRARPEFGGVCIWGTIGLEAVLRPDGSMMMLASRTGTDEPLPTREATVQERFGLLTDAARNHWSELQRLVPRRPPEATACSKCSGTGFVHKQILCPTCWSLGWLVDAAA